MRSPSSDPSLGDSESLARSKTSQFGRKSLGDDGPGHTLLARKRLGSSSVGSIHSPPGEHGTAAAVITGTIVDTA